ncbi:hypothetical protein UFOVP1627_22 [uncultured Caudovirales phage]|jgi:hypothetical protein|uniref:Uncharacterized protein n=1 Tax=uncultured Caudovirales phage TaxID=2100421 RepID=A0A6J5SW15_9CAUD|nr:hypothetical protein UFOVP1113_14 [uncultured Caudovirales phage]CAB4219762.1 hypothetical protein UFOVP1627_22 [uncultured Caudovirales phage]CAB5229909.1 hypothetical protein UFOVP1563_40 [uncultured Caudovirales phage]
MYDRKILEKTSEVPGAEDMNWSQRPAKPVRPQKPSDETNNAKKWKLGEMPQGGFRSILCFEDGDYSTKISRTSGGGKKVY